MLLVGHWFRQMKLRAREVESGREREESREDGRTKEWASSEANKGNIISLSQTGDIGQQQ